MQDKIIYVSGPMTGLPEFNHSEFNRVAKKLREQNYIVYNPAEIAEGDTTLPRTYYMFNSIKWLLNCNSVVVLKGWQTSRGALLEVAIAKELGMKFYDEELNELELSTNFCAKAVEEKKETICQEADRIVSEDRIHLYGHPKDNFARIAAIWTAILNINTPITPEEVGLCMIGLKLSRECHQHKRDNLTDICGFAKTIMMIKEE